MQTPKKIAIVGSGLIGSLLAIYLKNHGHEVTVFDRSPDIRKINFSGRSINMAMSNRGWKALSDIGLKEEIQKIGISMSKRAIHSTDKSITFQEYGKEGEAIFSLSRGVLNKKMIDLAEDRGVIFKFNQKIWDVTLYTATLHIGESEKSEWQELKFDIVFGADGAFSRIRHKMQRQSMFNYSQEFIPVGYKELHIPALPDGSYQLDKNALHIWPRGAFMLIALPNLDGSFTCTLFMSHEGKNSFESIKTEKDVIVFFETHFPDTKSIIPNLVADYFKNPTSFLVTMKCFPWTFQDKIALIGDASHAIVPFYGQGMNAGFEDISILNEMILKYADNWTTIFDEYQKSRKPNADAIATLSYQNFVEMSSKTSDANFLLQKKIEKWFSDKHPDKWMPLYSRVTFSLQPYTTALEIGNFQEKIMQEIMQIKNIKKLWNSQIVEDKIISLLKSI